MKSDRTSEATKPGMLEKQDFETYDRALYAGRQAYLAGLGIDACPYPRDTVAGDAWREGYDG